MLVSTGGECLYIKAVQDDSPFLGRGQIQAARLQIGLSLVLDIGGLAIPWFIGH